MRGFVWSVMFFAGCGRIGFAPIDDSCGSDPDLLACYAFEGNAIDSSANRLDATASGLRYVIAHATSGVPA